MAVVPTLRRMDEHRLTVTMSCYCRSSACYCRSSSSAGAACRCRDCGHAGYLAVAAAAAAAAAAAGSAAGQTCARSAHCSGGATPREKGASRRPGNTQADRARADLTRCSTQVQQGAAVAGRSAHTALVDATARQRLPLGPGAVAPYAHALYFCLDSSGTVFVQGSTHTWEPAAGRVGALPREAEEAGWAGTAAGMGGDPVAGWRPASWACLWSRNRATAWQQHRGTQCPVRQQNHHPYPYSWQ